MQSRWRETRRVPIKTSFVSLTVLAPATVVGYDSRNMSGTASHLVSVKFNRQPQKRERKNLTNQPVEVERNTLFGHARTSKRQTSQVFQMALFLFPFLIGILSL